MPVRTAKTVLLAAVGLHLILYMGLTALKTAVRLLAKSLCSFCPGPSYVSINRQFSKHQKGWKQVQLAPAAGLCTSGAGKVNFPHCTFIISNTG